MCKVCDKQRQFAEMVVDCMRRPEPDMNTFRAIEQAGVIVTEWQALVRRGIELCGSAEATIAAAARRVVRAIRVDKLAADIAAKRGHLTLLPSAAARGLVILQELGDDDPFRNKGRFEDINRPLWQRYFAHEREMGLRPDIVGWIEGFCNRYYRPVIDQLVAMLTHRSLDVRVAASAAVDRIEIAALVSAAEATLGRSAASPVALDIGADDVRLPSQFGDEEWEAVLVHLDGTPLVGRPQGSGLVALAALAARV